MRGQVNEKELQDLVQEQLEEDGWLTHHCRNSRLCIGRRGFPDLVAVRSGQLLVAELKAEDGRWSEDQLRWRLELRAAGIDVAELRPDTWEAKIRS